MRGTDGSAWLSANGTLHNVTVGGQLVRSVAGPGVVKELAMEPGSAIFWASTADKVTAHDAVSGAQLRSLTDLGNKPKVQDIAVGQDDLWVARGLAVVLRAQRLGGTDLPLLGQRQQRVVHRRAGAGRPDGGERHRPDEGQLSADLQHPGRAGEIDSANQELPVALAADGRGALWVATSASRLVHARGTSYTSLPISPPVTLRDLASFPREEGLPTISFASSTVFTNQRYQPVVVSYADAGSGADPSTLQVAPSIPDQLVSGSVAAATGPPFSCVAAEASAACTPSIAYQEGANTLTGTIRDYAGNTSSPSAFMTLRLDTQAPVVAISSPANGAMLTNPGTTFTLGYSDASSGIKTASVRLTAEGPWPSRSAARRTPRARAASPTAGFRTARTRSPRPSPTVPATSAPPKSTSPW